MANSNSSNLIWYQFFIYSAQILTKQLNELKLLTSCQTTKSNNNNEISVEMSSNDMTRYIKYQKKLVN